jgi:YD repeat protein
MKKLFVKFKCCIVLSALLSATNYSAFSQQKTIAWDKIPVIQSPQVWSFMKYGNMSSVDLYTGTVATSIPIYTYKDNDFEIPISINYASSGFIPNVPTGILGLGWYLNAGGCITREVRGIPDEKQVLILADIYTNIKVPYNGYLSYHCTSQSFPGWDSVILNNYKATYNPMLGFSIDGHRIETLSDIYHFRFGNHKGSFCLGPNHEVYVYDTDRPFGEYKFDFSLSYTALIITITDGAGYKYTFNGVIADNEEVDYNSIIDLRNNSGNEPYRNYICKTFLLRTIEAPNHRKVEFEYSEPIEYDIIKPHIYDLTTYKIGNNSSNFFTKYTESIYFIKQKTVNLTKIKIDNDNIISFAYMDKPSEVARYEANTISSVEKVLSGNKLLSNINVCNSITGQEVINCKLEYKTNNGNGNHITFLKSVKINQDPEYTLSYYNEDSKFPFHGTPHIDHWGYYNNSDYNHSLNLSNLNIYTEIDGDFNECFDSETREPNYGGAKFGMLHKIFYPTGGWTEYEYEGNTYSLKIHKNNISKGLPNLFPAGIGGCRNARHQDSIYNAGGLRVKRIINYSSNEMQSSKDYFYDYNGKSSGILQNYPRYKLGSKITYSSNLKDSIKEVSCTDLLAIKIDKHHIAYSDVIEKLNNKSFIKYNYIDYVTIPDDTTSVRFKADAFANTKITKLSPQYLDNYYFPAVSQDLKRGKVKSKEFFAQDSMLIRKIEYSYNQQNKYAEGLDVLKATWYVDKLLVGNFQLSRERQVDYCGSDSIVVTKTYKYNSLGQLISQKISDGDLFKSKYTYYPTDVSSTPIIDTMIARNMVRYPVLEFTTLGRKSTLGIMENGVIGPIKHEDVVEAYKREYKMNNRQTVQYPVLSSVLKATIAEPVNLGKTFPDLDYMICQSYDIYDKCGHIIQATSKEDIKTVYIWGYNGLYPVAVVENARLSTVKQINGLDNIESEPLTAGLNSEQEQQLRNLSDAHVTTYTYKPLIGITSVVDPSGRRKCYDYDPSGRLISIKDEDGNILESYDYRYENQ